MSAGAELEKYAIVAAARAVTDAWPARARAEFAAFVMTATREQLPAVDGDTPRERAANARQLARYWFRDWVEADGAASDDTADAARPPDVAAGLSAGDIDALAELMTRFGMEPALDLWRAERGRT